LPVRQADIDREIERRQLMAQIDAEIDRRSMDRWPTFRGAAAELNALFDMQGDRPFEVMIGGPAETGKTFSALWMLDRLMREYPGAQATIARKVRSSMDGSVLNTWRRVIAIRGGVTVYGGERPEWYDYPNGSRVWVAGLDNPGKALSSERDYIYVNQAEDLDLDDWQTLTTRATGRGAVAPWTMLFGDCNPSHPNHWIVKRRALRRLESRHEDNPSLYHSDGTLTDQGQRTMAILDALEGVLYERLRLGRWVAAEGAVYNFDRRLHITRTMPDGWQSWRKFRGIDFGFENPFVCLWAALDPDKRLYIYRQLYMTHRTVDQHAKTIKRVERWFKTVEQVERELAALPDAEARALRREMEPDHDGYWMLDKRTRRPIPNPDRERIEASVADHDAEGRATLASEGIITIPAKKEILDGIQAVQRRLRKRPDGTPGLYLLEDSLIERDEELAKLHHPLSIDQEFDVYSWPKAQDGKPLKEVPIKMYDHGMDNLRYLVRHIDRLGTSLIR
jgi:phage terminase large subunit